MTLAVAEALNPNTHTSCFLAYNLGSVCTDVRTAAWWPGSHLGCKQTWSHNLNTTNWISFKLGAERKLRRANMYANIYFLFNFKNVDMVAIFVLTPMITLFWPISRKLCKIGY